MGFKVGDKMVCVIPICDLIKDEVYTCAGYSRLYRGEVMIQEKPSNCSDQEYMSAYEKRFRKLDENSTSEFKSNAISKRLAQRAKEYNPIELPQHIEEEV
jgi:hypothetical protein